MIIYEEMRTADEEKSGIISLPRILGKNVGI